MTQVTVRNNTAEHRYEAQLGDDDVAFAEYQLRPGGIVFTHTEVPPEHEGQGVGSALAKFALDDARAQGLRVVPRCAFIRSYIEQHGEYADLVDD